MEQKLTLKMIATLSLPVSLAALGLKCWAYYLTNSIALYSDALESVVNVISAIVVWWAIHISGKPADREHPFGHYKAEYFSAGLVSMLIIIAGCLIINEAWGAIEYPKPLKELNIGLAINTGAAFVNAAWASFLVFVGKKQRSAALKADGIHLFGDVLTSGGVLVGLALGAIIDWPLADPVLALIVACYILWQGWGVLQNSIHGLMDMGVGLEEEQHIQKTISQNAYGAIEVHDLKTRLAGRATFIEFHLVVASNMSVQDAHIICDRIEEALKEQIENAYILIHVEPEEEAKLPPGTKAIPFA